ncbi:MAG: hypothetical protein ACI8PG_004230 [Planctomycetota bacterium]|jgi:hypothetical protein
MAIAEETKKSKKGSFIRFILDNEVDPLDTVPIKKETWNFDD